MPMDTLCIRCDHTMARGRSSWSKYALVPRVKRWYAQIISFGWFIAESVPFRVGTVDLSGSEDRTISRYPFQGNTCAIRLATTTVIALPRALARKMHFALIHRFVVPLPDGRSSVEYPFLSIRFLAGPTIRPRRSRQHVPSASCVHSRFHSGRSYRSTRRCGTHTRLCVRSH